MEISALSFSAKAANRCRRNGSTSGLSSATGSAPCAPSSRDEVNITAEPVQFGHSYVAFLLPCGCERGPEYNLSYGVIFGCASAQPKGPQLRASCAGRAAPAQDSP